MATVRYHAYLRWTTDQGAEASSFVEATDQGSLLEQIWAFRNADELSYQVMGLLADRRFVDLTEIVQDCLARKAASS